MPDDDDNIIFKYNTLEEGHDFFIKDKWQQEYHFKIFSFHVPTGLLSEAVEVITETSERVPRRITVLSDFDADEEEAELKLKAKVKKSINQRHLIDKNGEVEISREQVLRGTLSYAASEDTAFNLRFEIDGKNITIEQFVEMLYTYEGFNFKFRIYDPSDDMD